MAFDLENEIGIEKDADDIAGSLTAGFSLGYGAFSLGLHYVPAYTPEFMNAIEASFDVSIAE